MRAPGFWDNPPSRPGVAARLLSPLGGLYAAGTARRLAKRSSYTSDAPVICIGNLSAGGTGKTPTVIAFAEKIGLGVFVVSRGYGGTLEGPVLVDPKVHTAEQVGDEPLLLSAFTPVIVAKDRVAGAKFADEQDARVILLDDGFQDPSVIKSLSIVVVDAARGFGNGRCIPAGPLREPIHTGLSRADAVISIGAPKLQERFTKAWGDAIQVPRLQGQLKALETGMPWKGRRVLAFAGIGYPEKFFATLRELGADVIDTVALEDHAPLNATLIARLKRDAQAARAQLICTEKDSVRLPEDLRREVLPLPVRLRFKNDAALNDLLRPLGVLG